MAVVSGTVKDSSNNYVARLVQVYRKDNGLFVGDAVSNATTGAWSVTVPTTATKYFAVQHDGTVDSAWGNLVGGVRFNNDVGFEDIRGGVLSNSTTVMSSARSLFGGYSGLFDSSGYVLLYGAGGSTTFDLPGDFTIDIAFYPTDTTQRYLLSCGGAGSYDAYLLRAQAGVNCRFDTQNSGVWVTAYGPAPTVNEWNRLRVTRSGNSHIVYMNGVPGTAVSSATRAIAQTTGLYIGRSWYNGTYAFLGNVDETLIFKGVCLGDGSTYTPSATEYYSPNTSGSENALIYDDITPT